jgi:hypothetical protein
MAMSQGERMARLQEETVKYISRSKVRDSSEITHIRRAQASSTYIPASVSDTRNIGATVDTIGTNACNVTIKGKATNMEYISVLQSAEHNAICCGNEPNSVPGIYLPTPCYNHNMPPFAQQDITNPSMVYVPPCKAPENEQYFPNIVDSTCVYDRVITPSG